jgi:hypothetical protein
VAGGKGLYSIPGTISEFSEKEQRKYENCRQSRNHLSEILQLQDLIAGRSTSHNSYNPIVIAIALLCVLRVEFA